MSTTSAWALEQDSVLTHSIMHAHICTNAFYILSPQIGALSMSLKSTLYLQRVSLLEKQFILITK